MGCALTHLHKVPATLVETQMSQLKAKAEGEPMREPQGAPARKRDFQFPLIVMGTRSISTGPWATTFGVSFGTA
jgi:hypothetical protein